MVFLCETKKKARAMEKVKWSLGFRHAVAVDCEGRSGGLALLWRDHISVTLRPWCQYYIDAEIMSEGRTVRFTGVYGEPRMEHRRKTWDALHYLRRQDNLPWLCAGGFNEILFQTEQKGGNLRNFYQMEDFQECLGDCGLADLGFTGYPFTWDNKQDEGGTFGFGSIGPHAMMSSCTSFRRRRSNMFLPRNLTMWLC